MVQNNFANLGPFGPITQRKALAHKKKQKKEREEKKTKKKNLTDNFVGGDRNEVRESTT